MPDRAAGTTRPASWQQFCLVPFNDDPRVPMRCTREPDHDGDHQWEADRWKQFLTLRQAELEEARRGN